MDNCWPRSKIAAKKWCNLTLIGFVLNVMSIISSLITIIFFGVQLSMLKDYNYIYDYRDTECRLVSAKVREVDCEDSNMPLKWVAVFSTNANLDVVENPFAVRDYRSLALQDINHLILNSTYPCTCRSYIPFNETDNVPTRHGCAVWTTCILNIDFVKYMQRDNQRYYHTYISFVIASFISIVLTVAYFPISIKTLRDLNRQETYAVL